MPMPRCLSETHDARTESLDTEDRLRACVLLAVNVLEWGQTTDEEVE